MDEQAAKPVGGDVVIDGCLTESMQELLGLSQLRAIPHPPIGHERDLWLEVPDARTGF